MALNFNQLAMLQKLRSSVQTFRNNHPKFPLFLNAVSDRRIKGRYDHRNQCNFSGRQALFFQSEVKIR